MTDDERTYADDWAITEAISDKHGVFVVTGAYRKALLDLVREGRKAERAKIVEWLRSETRDCVWANDSETAQDIEAGEHLK